MDTSNFVRLKIASYKKSGYLPDFSEHFLDGITIQYAYSKKHCEQVAILSEAIAEKTSNNPQRAFFCGLLHDFGKFLLPARVFDESNANFRSEYDLAKTHARIGFISLKDIDLFTALCAGTHHNVYENGYGISMDCIPTNWSASAVKDFLETANIVSIADFADASTRKTTIRDGSYHYGTDLKSILYGKYFKYQSIVDIAIECFEDLFPQHAEIALSRKFE
jgi:hypothetical protein